MSSDTGSSNLDGQANVARSFAPVDAFTLRDLYVHTSISSDSLAAELGRYLNIDETTFSSSANESSGPNRSVDAPAVHEPALEVILDVVSNSTANFECVWALEPEGGIQEWWARMLVGTAAHSQSKLRVRQDVEICDS